MSSRYQLTLGCYPSLIAESSVIICLPGRCTRLLQSCNKSCFDLSNLLHDVEATVLHVAVM